MVLAVTFSLFLCVEKKLDFILLHSSSTEISKSKWVYSLVKQLQWMRLLHKVMNKTKVYNKVYPRLKQHVLISYLICVRPVLRSNDHHQGRCWVLEQGGGFIPGGVISHLLNYNSKLINLLSDIFLPSKTTKRMFP